MTWTLVQKSAAVANASNGTVTGTLPGGSAAGNLIVACLGSNVAGTQFTGPAGWVQGIQIGNGSLSRAEIWYLPVTGNGGGITTAAFTCGTGIVRAALGEFHTDVANAAVSLDFAGTGTDTSSVTCKATGNSNAGDLLVSSFLEHLGSNSAVTWTDPSGWTLLDSNTASGSNQLYSAYKLAAGGGSLGVTATSSVASAANGFTGVVASFSAVAVASNPVAVGCTSNNNAFPAGTTNWDATQFFAAATGRPVQVRKIFYVLGPVRANGTVDLSAQFIDNMIAAGMKAMLCFAPPFNPTSQAAYDNLNTTLAAYQAAGLNAEVVLWQEPANADKHMSAAQYGMMVQFYKGAITPYYPLVASLNYVGTSSTAHFTDYFNAPPAGTFAKGYIDFYARAFPQMSLDAAAAACDAQGVPFGISEWGCNPQIDTRADCIAFMQYVTNFQVARKNNGQPIGDHIWYGGPGPGPGLAMPITNPPQPGCDDGTGHDFRIPYYQAAFDALTSAGPGTVSLAASLKVAATASGTMAGGGAPAPVPAPGPVSPGPGMPQVITEIGVVPTSPVPSPGTFLLDDTTFGVLNVDTLGAVTQWADISSFVKSFTVARTSTRQNAPVITYDPGTESAVLDNSDGRFDPDNTGGTDFYTDAYGGTYGVTAPYVAAGVSQIHPMTPKRTRAVWQGVTYPLFSGFADSWVTPDTNYGPNTSETNLSATDGFKILAGFQLAAAAATAAAANLLPEGGGEDSGARIRRLLNLAGWDSGARQIDAGNSFQQGTSLQGPDALTELQLAADTELGELFCNGSGQVVFRRRHGVMEDARSSVPQAVFGDNPGAGGLLNSNPGFEGPGGSTAGWVTQNGATLQASGLGAYSGASFGLFFGDGVTAFPGIVTSPGAAVTPGQYVTFSTWLEGISQPWPVNTVIRFFDGAGVLIATIKTQIQTAVGVWQQAVAGGFAPAGAVTCKAAVVMTGTPASPNPEVGVDEAYLQVVSELPYSGLGRADDDTQLCNDAQVTAAGSSNLQEATDAASIAKFLYPRSYQRSDLLLSSDDEALAWAQFVVYLSKGAENRFDTITLSPQRDARLWPHALGREIGDMIAVIRRPPGAFPVTKQLIIRGVTHTVTVSPAAWTTQWILQDASRYSFLTLGDSVQGTLDQNALAF